MNSSADVTRACCVVALLVGATTAHADSTFDDGQVHTIATTEAFIRVFDGTNEDPTTLNVIAPADVSFVFLYEHSNCNIEGGEVSHLQLLDASVSRVTGGNMSHIKGFGTSDLTFTGGDVSHVRMADESQALFGGGFAQTFSVYDRSIGEIHGGIVNFAMALGTAEDESVPAGPMGSFLSIQGGLVGVARARAGSVIEILNGIVGDINPFELGTTNVYGGVIREMTLNLESETNVYGSNFALTFEGFVHSVPQYRLTGDLRDGSALNAKVSLPAGAELNLITIAEPATIAMLGIAVPVMFAWSTTRKQKTS